MQSVIIFGLWLGVHIEHHGTGELGDYIDVVFLDVGLEVISLFFYDAATCLLIWADASTFAIAGSWWLFHQSCLCPSR